MDSTNSSKSVLSIVFVGLVCALLNFFCNSYFYLVSDQFNYLPFVYKLNDSLLYSTDYFAAQNSAEFSIWMPIVAYLFEVFDHETLFFVAHILANTLFFCSLYYLSKKCVNNDYLALAFPVFFIFNYPIFGAALNTLDTYFHVRSFVYPSLILSIVFFVQRRYFICTVLCSISFLIHPIMTLPIIVIIGLYILFQSIKSREVIFIACLFVFIATALYFLSSLLEANSNSSLFTSISQNAFKVVQDRVPAAFFGLWHEGYQLLFLLYVTAFSLFLCAVSATNVNGHNYAQNIKWLYIGVLIFLSLGVLFTDLITTRIGILSLHLRVKYFFILLFPLLLMVSLKSLLDQKLSTRNHVSICMLLLSWCFLGWSEPIFIFLVLGVLIFMGLTLNMQRKVIFSKSNTYVLSATFFTIVTFFIASKISISSFVIQDALALLLSLLSSVSFLITLALLVSLSVLFILIQNFNFSSKYYDFFVITTFLVIAFVSPLKMIAPKLFNDGFDSVSKAYNINMDKQKVELAEWISINTLKSDLFLINPNDSWFRTVTKRSVVALKKDGGHSILSDDFALDWSSKISTLNKYNNLGFNRLCALAKEYNADYFMMTKPASSIEEFEFTNEVFTLYKAINCN